MIKFLLPHTYSITKFINISVHAYIWYYVIQHVNEVFYNLIGSLNFKTAMMCNYKKSVTGARGGGKEESGISCICIRLINMNEPHVLGKAQSNQ